LSAEKGDLFAACEILKYELIQDHDD